VKLNQDRLFSIAISLAMLGVTGLSSQGYAQLAIKLVGPDGQSQDVTARNTPRGDEAMVLYDTDYGKSTRTNAYGVEVIAVPVQQAATGATPNLAANSVSNPASSGNIRKAYKVTNITSVWDCTKPNGSGKSNGLTCGNADIPVNGIVISATGSRRNWLKTLKPGDTLSFQEDWFQQRQAHIGAIDPSPTNNPLGSGFPGFRASNQIVVYDSGYGRPNTGTNEFGFEVTVRNGIVTDQEGSDSTIPADGFILSGHGRGRSWLIGNAPIGAKIQLSPDGKTVNSTIDFDTYIYQFDQRWASSPCADSVWTAKPSVDHACDVIRGQRENALRLQAGGLPVQAAETIQEALNGMNVRIWQSYTAFPNETIRGAWHRPVETTAAKIGQTLDTLKAAGINTIFLETYFHGYTIFPSKTFRDYGLPEENPKFKGVDLLQLWTEEAHKRDMKVHAWFQVFYGGTKAYKPPGPILSKYPSWANVQFAALVPVQQPLMPTPVGTSNPAMATSSGVTSTQNGAGTASSTNVYKSIPQMPALPGTPNPNSQAASTPQQNFPAPNAPTPNAPASNALPLNSTTLRTPDKPVPSNLELGGYFLDPANPEVQDFLVKLSDEIVSRYKIDGYQLDYIRYPASFPANRYSYRRTTWGYTNIARNAFKTETGVDPVDIDPKNPRFEMLWATWNQYKVNQINHFVERVTQSIRKIKPDMKISAAVFPDADSALAVKHQDWRSWGQKGWVDFYAPMTLTSAPKVVGRDTRQMVQVFKGKIPVYSGIFGPFNENTAEQVLDQINTAKMAGASGYVLFDTAHLTPHTLDALRMVQVTNHKPKIEALTDSPVPTDTAESAKTKKHHWWSRK
jgi:uncharacterized lipoprotein YddW (UPF0748 family)